MRTCTSGYLSFTLLPPVLACLLLMPLRAFFLFLLDSCTSKWHYIDERHYEQKYAYTTRFPSAHNNNQLSYLQQAVASALLVCKRTLAQEGLRPCHICRLLRLLVLMDCRQLPAQVRISGEVHRQELQDPEGGWLQQEHCSRRRQ